MRQIRNLKMTEISAVDDPAQEGARVVLMKRRDGTDNRQQTLDLGDAAELAKALTNALNANKGSGGDNAMTDEERKKMEEEKAQREGEMKKLAEEVAGLKKSNERLETISKLSADERAHFDGIEGAEAQDAFLAKDAEGRKAEIGEARKAAADSDPVVFKSRNGTEFRKSDGAAVIALAKRNDEQEAKIEKMERERETARLEKRATEDFSHLPGDVATRAALVKAVESIEDEEVRKNALESITAGNNALGAVFKQLGTAAPDPTNAAAEPTAQLEKLAKAHQEANAASGMTYEQAYDAVLDTTEGKVLYTTISEADAA